MYISSDETFEDYFETLDKTGWWALPFGSEQNMILKGMFEVTKVPVLVVVD